MPILRNQQLVGDRYRLLQQLGSGGMADVWLAVDESDEDLVRSGDAPKVALKFMNEFLWKSWMNASRTKGGSPKDPKESEYYKRFLREVKLQAQLRHENLVQVLAAGLYEGYPYYVSEYIDGKTLWDEIMGFAKERGILNQDGDLPLPSKRPKPLETSVYPLEDFFREADQVCKAFIYLHDNPTPGIKQIIHRDIKPQNMMVVRNRRNVPTLKLMDFGIAKVFELDPLASQITREGVPGSPPYMAIEAFWTSSKPYKDKLGQVVPIGPPADIYALGMVMFVMMTGVLPHIDKPYGDIIDYLLSDREDPDPAVYWPGIPRKLREVVMKCIAKQPWDRYQDADQLRSALIDAEAEIFGPRRGSSQRPGGMAFNPTVRSEPPPALISQSDIPTRRASAVMQEQAEEPPTTGGTPVSEHQAPRSSLASMLVAAFMLVGFSVFGTWMMMRPPSVPPSPATPPAETATQAPLLPEPVIAEPAKTRKAEPMDDTARQAFDYGKTVAKRDCRAAIRSFELAKSSSPNAPEIYAEMAKCYRSLRMTNQALEAEQTARSLQGE